MGAFGIETSPRELAKIALCVADKGRWKGQQVLDSTWLEEMYSPQVQRGGNKHSFGFYWWIDEKRDIYFMDGHGGQFAFISPEKNLVVIMTSFPNTQGDYQIRPEEAVLIMDKTMEAAN